jgi:hypothetical protein
MERTELVERVRGIERGRMIRDRERSVIDRGRGAVRGGECYERHGVAVSKIAVRIKVFKVWLLNVCKREYGI